MIIIGNLKLKMFENRQIISGFSLICLKSSNETWKYVVLEKVHDYR